MTQLIHIEAIPALKDNYIWAMVNQETRSAFIVDPGVAEVVRDFLTQKHLNLSGILITHHHWDHTNGLHELKEWYDVPVYGPASIQGVTSPVTETVTLTDSPIGFTVYNIPGHTLDHIAYYTSGLLFCGDTLFAAGCGRLFEGTALQMYTSLEQLSALPLSTNVYCAHEYTLNNLNFAASLEPNNKHIQDKIKRVKTLREEGLSTLPSTIQDEKNTNPFLRCEVPAVIQAAEKHAGGKLATPLEVFTTLRAMKDNW